MGIKFSQFINAFDIFDDDYLVGVQTGSNKRFTMLRLLQWFKSKITSSDISYDPTISGASATNVQDALDEAFSDVDDKQEEITASGILKGDGAGGVSAAVAGTDYQAPLTAGTDYATPAMIPSVPSAYTSNPAMDGTASPGSSGAWAKGDHVHPTDSTKAAKSDLTSIQATGTTNTTGAAIPAGTYFYLNGVLYRAKTQIDQNAPFTVNTNCEQVPDGGLNNVGFIDISSYISVNQSRLNSTRIKARYYPGSKKVELQAEGTVATTLSAGQNTLFLAALQYAPPSGEQQFAGCGIKNSQTPVAVWANSASINVQHGGASVGDKIAISLSWLLR